MFLEEITNSEHIENDRFECKSKLNKEDPLSFLKTIAGFSNNKGGTFYIGVEDKTNKLIGFNREEADKERNYFNNQINEHLTPRPNINIEFLRYEIRDKELFVIKVNVYESLIKPIIVKYNGIPSIYMRRDGFTNGATYEEIINMSISSKKVQYDSLSSNIKYNRDDFKKLFDFYALHNNNKQLSDKALKSLGFFDDDNNLSNGALFFKDDYKDDKTLVQCSLYSGFNKGSERIISINKFKGNIIDSISYVMDFISSRMNHTIIKEEDGRINIDSYPHRALFEGVINAFAHRDYYIDGSQIQFDMFKDRLEISSPGSFYNGEIIKKTYDLSNIISKRRNNIICGVLVLCNVMEAAGTGFDKILEEYKNVDLKHKPYIFSTSDHFTLVLPDLTYEKGIEDNSYTRYIYPPIEKESKYDKQILAYCYGNARTTKEIATYLNISDSSYLRSSIIDNLVKQNLLIKSDNTKNRVYKTNQIYITLQ